MALTAVQQKVSCLYETVVVSEASSKRPQQSFKVVASDSIKQSAIESQLEAGVCSEKIDGTCVYAGLSKNKPWLWARLDRKPAKPAEKKFKVHQRKMKDWELNMEGEKPAPFVWDTLKDFKDAPDEWIPAHGVPLCDGIPQPDEHGHMPGWVPLTPTSRQYCWHNEVVNLEHGVCLTLEQRDSYLELRISKLSDVKDYTFELIGTHINGNPYNIGCKQRPLHLLVRHGSITFKQPPLTGYNDLCTWLTENDEGQVEGVVWHCSNGKLFKVHRHHISLPWPVERPRLAQIPVKVNVDLKAFSLDDACLSEKSLFVKLSELNSQTFPSLCAIFN